MIIFYHLKYLRIYVFLKMKRNTVLRKSINGFQRKSPRKSPRAYPAYGSIGYLYLLGQCKRKWVTVMLMTTLCR